jgi:hypothetical protein
MRHSGIKWQEVTWYSRLGAIVLFIGVVPALAFYIGTQYALIGQEPDGFLSAPSAPASQLSSEEGDRLIDLAHDSSFPKIQDVLSALVAKEGAQKSDNSFCVVGYANNDEQYAWVYWPQGDAIILWEPQTTAIADLTLTRRYLHLKTDIAIDDNVPGYQTSMYMEDLGWLTSVLHDCATRGLTFTIPKQ